MFGWPVKAGCKVCFRTVPMWFGFVLFQFVCEHSLDGGGHKVPVSYKKNPHPSPYVYTTVQFHFRTSQKKRDDQFRDCGWGAVVYVRVKEGRRGGGAVTE